MRVTVVSAFYLPHIDGVGKYVEELARRTVAAGHQVRIITNNTDHAPASEMLDGVEVIRLAGWNFLGGTYPVPSPKSCWHLFRLLTRAQTDVVNTHTRFFWTSFLAIFFSRLHRVPTLHTEHGTIFVQHPNTLVGFVAQVFDLTFGRYVVRSATRCVGVAQASVDFVKKLGRSDADIIYNGVDPTLFASRQQPEHVRRIVFVGRLISAKNVQQLIAVFKNISLHNTSLELRIIGDGNFAQALHQQAAGIPGISFLGELPGIAVRRELAAADIFINPSLAEGLPTSVLEAGAAGLAVIATDAGGTREILNSEDVGCLYPVRDDAALEKAISAFVNQPQRCYDVGCRLRRRVEEVFSWDKIAPVYIGTLYEATR